jgi:hypothetical protein
MKQTDLAASINQQPEPARRLDARPEYTVEHSLCDGVETPVPPCVDPADAGAESGAGVGVVGLMVLAAWSMMSRRIPKVEVTFRCTEQCEHGDSLMIVAAADANEWW